MNTSTQHTDTQAYVINPDGTRTAAQVTFADHGSTRFAQTPGYGYGYAQADGSAGAVQPRLHLGRRVAGLAIAALGVPLLILPGPGLAMIGLGLAMALLP